MGLRDDEDDIGISEFEGMKWTDYIDKWYEWTEKLLKALKVTSAKLFNCWGVV